MNTFCLSHSFVLGDVVVVCLLGDVGAGLNDLVLGASAAHPPAAASPHLRSHSDMSPTETGSGAGGGYSGGQGAR